MRINKLKKVIYLKTEYLFMDIFTQYLFLRVMFTLNKQFMINFVKLQMLFLSVWLLTLRIYDC